MTKLKEDFLVELHTEELPPKALLKLAKAFCELMRDRLEKASLTFEKMTYFATPRRLALLVSQLAESQPEQVIERKGPAKSAAFDEQGHPSKACEGFARSLGISPHDLITIKNAQGEWVGFRQRVVGQSVKALLPEMVEQIATALPIPKRMRWGDNDAQFTRPIHSIIMLYGDEVIDGTILGFKSNRLTRGHRFHAPDWLSIPHASEYASLLETKAHVVASFEKREAIIHQQASECVKQKLGEDAHVICNDELLKEVTGLVEWPKALCGQFDQAFLNLPAEVLISSMQDHQRYFPVRNSEGKLLPYFVTISNIESHDPARVIHGNERVLRARLSDAAFFFETDKKESLDKRVAYLKGIVFQAKLGTLFDKTERLIALSEFMADKLGRDKKQAARAALLAKTDLTTQMVGEFPELQGTMGYYYAKHDGEADSVAEAMKEQYLPRFSGDNLPHNDIGQILALADRIDTLTGVFGIKQFPTGDKDPFGLRRQALGIFRILVENKIDLDLKEVLTFAATLYGDRLENSDTISHILTFIQERMRAWYQEQGVGADVFAAVAALEIANPFDVQKRIKAVSAFKKLQESEALSVANKRVSNILANYQGSLEANIDTSIFENAAERELAHQLELKSQAVRDLYQSRQYDEVLLQLAALRKPVDDFFDQVMVMTDNQSQRENRLLMLNKLRALFLQVADIAMLQS